MCSYLKKIGNRLILLRTDYEKLSLDFSLNLKDLFWIPAIKIFSFILKDMQVMNNSLGLFLYRIRFQILKGFKKALFWRDVINFWLDIWEIFLSIATFDRKIFISIIVLQYYFFQFIWNNKLTHYQILSIALKLFKILNLNLHFIKVLFILTWYLK